MPTTTNPLRRGPGRPPNDIPRPSPLHVRVDTPTYDAVCLIAIRRGCSLNVVIKDAIAQYLVVNRVTRPA